MTAAMPQESFADTLFPTLEETFDTQHGIYLDKGDPPSATLDQNSAAKASIPVGDDCAAIAAQVEHTVFYLKVLERYIAGQDVGRQDWGEIWGRVSGVTTAEWDALGAGPRATYDRLSEVLENIESWQPNDAIGDPMAIVVHASCNLGEIREALSMVGRTASLGTDRRRQRGGGLCQDL